MENISKRKFMSTRVSKMLFGAIAICLMGVLTVAGVLAATSVSVGIGSTVSFTATDVSAKIYVRALHKVGNQTTDLSSTIAGSNILTENDGGTYNGYKYLNITSSDNFGTITFPTIQFDSIATVLGYGANSDQSVQSSCIYYEFIVKNTGDRNIRFSANTTQNSSINNLTVGYAIDLGENSTTKSNEFDIVSAFNKRTGQDLQPLTDATEAEGKFVMYAYVNNIGFEVESSTLNLPITLTAGDYYGTNAN